jgi:malate synthase
VETGHPPGDRFDEILNPDALNLITALHREFGARRHELLAARARRQEQVSAGAMLGFLPETAAIRADSSWRVVTPAPGLVDRQVEITGPTDKKMTIDALNSGAKVWLADFEDANTPLWENMINGQLNLRDALDRTIDFTNKEGKDYKLRPDDELATIVVRPCGWHLPEKHILIDGDRAYGSLVDFALYFFHCAQRQLDKGKGPYFYLAKMGSHLEARLWNDAFVLAQETLGIPHGTIRATVLIETIPAAFRDGRDPLRAARPQRRAERRPVGLSVQHYQEVPDPRPRLRAARPERGHYDCSLHARVHRVAGEDLPRPRRPRDGRHGGLHPQPRR